MRTALATMAALVVLAAVPAISNAAIPYCNEVVNNPTYLYTTTPPLVEGEGIIDCQNPNGGQYIQAETCIDQNWGAGWSTVTQSCKTSNYDWTSSKSLWSYTVDSYCGRWYRTRFWVYVNGVSYPWVFSNANYRC